MVATMPTVTPTIVPVHEEELELVPVPDRCVESKEDVVVMLAPRNSGVVVFMAVEVVDDTVGAGWVVVTVAVAVVVTVVGGVLEEEGMLLAID